LLTGQSSTIKEDKAKYFKLQDRWWRTVMAPWEEPICEGTRLQGESICRYPWILRIRWRPEAWKERCVCKI